MKTITSGYTPPPPDGRGGIDQTREEWIAAQKRIAARDRKGLNAGLRDQSIVVPKTNLQAPTFGVEGYTQVTGTLASLDPQMISDIEKNISGQMDNTLKNLTFAHLEVFGTMPTFDLTADILDEGDVEFETVEEAIQFFEVVKQSYEGTDIGWQMEATGSAGKGMGQIPGFLKDRIANQEEWSAETDRLDPEMIASFNPEKVEDLLFGPYMKRNIKGKSSMFRDGALRLDEMLVALPKQWAISNLAESVGRQGRMNNPDLGEDEALMKQLNEFLISRVPAQYAPAATAAWQDKTEEALRILQRERAMALYLSSGKDGEASGETAVEAGAFLQAQGFGNVIDTLDQQIRQMTVPSGSTPEAERQRLDSLAAMTEQMWVASRNPGVLERVALTQLHDLNPNATTLATQKMVGGDTMMSRFGMLKGIANFIPSKVAGIPLPGGGDIGDVESAVWNSSEMRILRTYVPATAAAVVSTLSSIPLINPYTGDRATSGQAVAAGFGAMIKFYEERNIDLVTMRQYFDDIGAVHYENPDSEVHQAMRLEAWAEHLTILSKDDKDSFLEKIPGVSTIAGVAFGGLGHDIQMESMGTFFERWKFYHENNQNALDAGIPMQYTDELMRSTGMNPAANPEASFLIGFAFDTVFDVALFKGAGALGGLAKSTRTWQAGSKLAGSALNVRTTFDVTKSIAADTLTSHHGGRINLAAPKKIVRKVSDTDSFATRLNTIFGVDPEEAVALGERLTQGVKLNGARASQDDIIREAIPNFTDSGKGKLHPDTWAIHDRAKEIMLYKQDSPLYRAKHPMATYFLERTYNLRKFSMHKDQAGSSAQRIASEIRTTIGKQPGGFRHALEQEIDDHLAVGDARRVRVLQDIRETEDINQFADFVAGRFLHAEVDAATEAKSLWIVDRQLRFNHAVSPLNKRKILAEVYEPDTEKISNFATNRRAKIAENVDLWNSDLGLMTPASKSFTRMMLKRFPNEARLLMDSVEERGFISREPVTLSDGTVVPAGTPLRHVPLEAERRKWMEKQIPKGERAPKGIKGQAEVIAEAMEDMTTDAVGTQRNPNAVMLPSQGLHFTGSKAGTPKKARIETSKAFRYDQTEALINRERQLAEAADQARRNAGLLTQAEAEAANKQLDALLLEQRTARSVKQQVGESVRDYDRRIHELVSDSILQRDVAKARADAALILKPSQFSSKALYKEARDRLSAAYEKQVRESHAELNRLHDEASDALDSFDRALPFPENAELHGGPQLGVHQQIGVRGIPRGGRSRASVEVESEMQLRQRRRVQLMNQLREMEDAPFPATRTQIAQWVEEARERTDQVTRRLTDRLETFVNLSPQGQIDTTRVADEFQDTLKALMETKPGDEVADSNAAEFFKRINTLGGTPEDVARQALEGFDTIFGDLGLPDEVLFSLRKSLGQDLRDLSNARRHEQLMKDMELREKWFEKQNPDLSVNPQLNVVEREGTLTAAPKWGTRTGVATDRRLALPDDVATEILDDLKFGAAGRVKALDRLTEWLESKLIYHDKSTVEQKDWSFIQRKDDPPGYFWETNGRTPPGSTEALWSPEQMAASVNEDWNVVQRVSATNEGIQSGVGSDVLRSVVESPDDEFRQAVTELMDRIWAAHINGEGFNFFIPVRTFGEKNVAKRPRYSAKGGKKSLPIMSTQAKTRVAAPVVEPGNVGSRLSLQLEEGKWILVDSKTGKRAVRQPHIISTDVIGEGTHPLASPFRVRPVKVNGKVTHYQVIDLKTRKVTSTDTVTRFSKADAQNVAERLYWQHLDELDASIVKRELAAGRRAGAIVIDGDMKSTLRQFLDDLENGVRRKIDPNDTKAQIRDAELGYPTTKKQMQAQVQGLYGEALVGFLKNNLSLRAPTRFRTPEGQALARELAAKSPARRAVALPQPTTPMNIWWGTKENASLSNLAVRPFTYQGHTFQSVEHAYQTLKTGKFNKAIYDKDWSKGGRVARGPAGASGTDPLMKQLILESYKANPADLEDLLATGTRTLTHTQGGAWKERFPRLLMEVREELGGAEIPWIPSKQAKFGGDPDIMVLDEYIDQSRPLPTHPDDVAKLREQIWNAIDTTPEVKRFDHEAYQGLLNRLDGIDDLDFATETPMQGAAGMIDSVHGPQLRINALKQALADVDARIAKGEKGQPGAWLKNRKAYLEDQIRRNKEGEIPISPGKFPKQTNPAWDWVNKPDPEPGRSWDEVKADVHKKVEIEMREKALINWNLLKEKNALPEGMSFDEFAKLTPLQQRALDPRWKTEIDYELMPGEGPPSPSSTRVTGPDLFGNKPSQGPSLNKFGKRPGRQLMGEPDVGDRYSGPGGVPPRRSDAEIKAEIDGITRGRPYQDISKAEERQIAELVDELNGTPTNEGITPEEVTQILSDEETWSDIQGDTDVVGVREEQVATAEDLAAHNANALPESRYWETAELPRTPEAEAIRAEIVRLAQEEQLLRRQLVNTQRNDLLLNVERRVATQRYLDAKAVLYGGTKRGISREAVHQLKRELEFLKDVKVKAGVDVGTSTRETRQEIMDKIDDAGRILDKLEGDPEGFRTAFGEHGLSLETEAGMEWQLKQWHYSTYNYSKLSKFLAGGAIKHMEWFNARKIGGINWSIDDFTTLYKTIVMMKVSTMLRIPLADEATRFISEGINPLRAWKRSRMLKDFDKMPDDIQFKVSELIRTASDGSYDWIDYAAKDSFIHYQKMVTASRRDPTFARFLLGKRMLSAALGGSGKKQMADEVAEFLATGTTGEKNLRTIVRRYLDASLDPANQQWADELMFKAWYAMGYRRGGGLRKTGLGSHRFIEYTEDGGKYLDTSLQKNAERYYANDPVEATAGKAVRTEGGTRSDGSVAPGVKGDAQGLVDALYKNYSYWYDHPTLGRHWQPKNGWAMTSQQEEWAKLLENGTVPNDMLFGKVYNNVWDQTEAKNAWEYIASIQPDVPLKVWDPQLQQYKMITPTAAQVQEWQPILFGQRTFSGTNDTVLHSLRDGLYKILDYSGAKMNEMVYADAFTKNVDILTREASESLGRKLVDAEIVAIEKKAHFTARNYMERVMFTNVTYGGEEFLRNVIMFLPAYRQFATYWAPYLAKHPFALSLVYRANRDKDKMKMNMGGFEFDFSRMSFLINQSDTKEAPLKHFTGWLPSGAPLLTFPVSTMAHIKRNEKDNVWGNLAGNWPFEFAGEFSALNSPLDKIVYGATAVLNDGEGWTLPWPFGTDPTKNPWRAIQIQNEALVNHGKTMSGREAMWKVGVNRLIEGGWNFFSPIGGRVADEDIQGMMEGRRAYNAATTPGEVQKVLGTEDLATFKTFLEWQNLPDYEKMDFISQHPEIVPFAVSGYTAGENSSGTVGILWDKMSNRGVPNPEAYVQRVDEMYTRIAKIEGAEAMRERRDAEEGWWADYKSDHSGDHNIERLDNEWDTSSGAFAVNGSFYMQGKRGKAFFAETLNNKYVGIDDPYTGITYNPDQKDHQGDAYRLAKFMDTIGGASRAYLQASPNYEMYVLGKYSEQQENVSALVKSYVDRRVSTRLTDEEIIGAGYTQEEAGALKYVVQMIDDLWDAADRTAEQVGGYPTTGGRAVRKTAILAQNRIIHSSLLVERFLGDNVAGLYSTTYLTKPSWQRSDLIRFDNMDKAEREAVEHLLTEEDPDTGEYRLKVPYIPESKTQVLELGTVLSYLPDGEGGWQAKIDVGGAIGTVPVRAPAGAKKVTAAWQKVNDFFSGGLTSSSLTQGNIAAIRADMEATSMPQWGKDLIEDDIRAQAWRSWLEAAAAARKALRETPNEYYDDAPGYSAISTFGKEWKTALIAYGLSLSTLSPAFAEEWDKYNGDNRMTNTILDWYL